MPECNENKNIVEYYSDTLDINYQAYNYDIPTVIKLIKTLNDVDSKFAVICADKDFLIPKGIEKAVIFLENNPDYSIAHGVNGIIRVQNELLNSQHQRIITMSESQSTVNDNNALIRLKNHFRNYEATFYSVHQTNDLLNNMQKAASLNSSGRFEELLSSGLSLIQGKAKCLDILYHIRQYKPNLSTAKKYTWNSVIKADDFEFQCKMVVDCLSEEIDSNTGISQGEARSVVKEAFDIYMAPIKEIFNKYQEFKSQLNHNHKYHERIIGRISRLKRVLPVAMQLALKVNQLMSMVKSPIKTYRQIASELNDYDRAQKAYNEPSNTLHINKLLDPNSPYHADFMPIYKIVRRYPDGIFN